jgi:hypothetical protein
MRSLDPRVPLRVLQNSDIGTFFYFDSDGSLHWDITRWLELVDGVKGRSDDFVKQGPDKIKDLRWRAS